MNDETAMEHMVLERERLAKMERPMAFTPMMPRMGTNTNMHLGRGKLPWSQEIWNRIDQAVHDECKRTKIAPKFLPMYGPISPLETTVPADRVVLDGQTLAVIETETVPVVEIIADFRMTLQQVQKEEHDMTAVTLASRAANHLSQAEDLLIFQGQAVTATAPLFTTNQVRLISGDAGIGLVNAAARNQIVPRLQQRPPGALATWGENTFGAVAAAYSLLQTGNRLPQAHYGPYALALNTVPYTDIYAPLPTTLIFPWHRISPLMMRQEVHGTGTLPDLRGILVSLGGNTMDLVMGMDATTAFLQEDPDGRYRFRVYERFALRLKDPSAVIRLEFEPAP
jgi:uncharacterized linocin/CFP29 family protein